MGQAGQNTLVFPTDVPPNPPLYCRPDIRLCYSDGEPGKGFFRNRKEEEKLHEKTVASTSWRSLLLLTAFAACTKVGPPTAGSAKAEDMLTLLPKETTGVILIDVNRALNTEVMSKALKEGENAQKYQETIKKLGIDPQKDVYFVAIGLTGSFSGGATSGVGVLNLKYSKDALLAKMKEEGAKFTEGVYEGVSTITVVEDEKFDSGREEGRNAEKRKAEKKPRRLKSRPCRRPEKVMIGAFLDASNIAIGPEKEVKAVIDVLKKKGENATGQRRAHGPDQERQQERHGLGRLRLHGRGRQEDGRGDTDAEFSGVAQGPDPGL